MGRRLFIAIDIDEATRNDIGRVSDEVRSSIMPAVKASWVKPDRMHLTLHFFGTVEHEAEQQIRDALSRPIAQRSFDVSFDGVGTFPARGSPRVLWLGVGRGGDELRRLHDELGRRLRTPPEDYSPHLTLARIRDRVPRASVARIASLPAVAGPCRIDRVTLYESRLSPAGSTYIRLVEAALKP